MGFFKLLFCLIFLFRPAIISGKNICRASKCGEVLVKFPFRSQNRQPTNCGYPGFDLSCNYPYLSLKLPQSGEFYVRSIDYLRQEITLYDPSGCVAERLPKLNLSGSPFKAIAYMAFSFLSCPSQSVSVSSWLAVGCLSNLTNTVIANPSTSLFRFSYTCQELYGRAIQVPQSSPSNNDLFSQFSQLGADIPLRWDVPDCGGCESKGRTCGFDYNSSRLTCHKHRTVAKGVKIFGLVSLSITICGFVVSFFICITRVGRMSTDTFATTTAQVQNFYPPAAGLDETTIQSYTKVVLGESCRLPGGESDGTCTICLCEYTAREIVKCIPECKHYFHAGCIDEWLRLAGTCPVCRITPSPSPIYAGP